MFRQKYIVRYFATAIFLGFAIEHSSQSVLGSTIDQASNIHVKRRSDGSDTPRRIDTHSHIIPDFYAAAVQQAGGDPSGGPNPPWSLEQTYEQMSQLGIETAIVSITSPGTKIYENNITKGRDLARQLNEFSANLVKNDSKRFGYFASLPPLTDVEGALNEIDYVQSVLKPDGYTLYTSYGYGKYLGYPSFQPIWAKLNALKTVVLVHPSAAPTTVVDRYLPMPIADFPQETTRTAADIVLTGTRAMFPDVKIILPHAGGTIPFLAYRIAIVGLAPQLQCPRNYSQIIGDFKSFYFDTALSSSTPQLLALLNFADPSKIVFGSDLPYTPFPIAVAMTNALDAYFLESESDHDKKTWKAINHRNAKLLFDIK